MGPSGGLGHEAIVGQVDNLNHGAVTSHVEDPVRGGAIMQKRFEKYKKVDFQED